VSDDSSSLDSLDPGPAWKELAHQGYALIQDWTLGVTDEERKHFRQRYFSDETLRQDAGDWPRDRKRARDVIHYEWSDSGLTVREYETITITNRAGIEGKREHKRVELLADPQAKKLVETLLHLVPEDRRQQEGTLGVNFFRTYTDVVTRPHHDDEEYIFLYMMHRDGDGARSYLYRDYEPFTGGPPDEPALDYHQLNPGEILFFEDKLFTHGATPLEPPAHGTALRDMIVITVDYPGTYLRRDQLSQ
jgi:2OG-Fe dioxygenase